MLSLRSRLLGFLFKTNKQKQKPNQKTPKPITLDNLLLHNCAGSEL